MKIIKLHTRIHKIKKIKKLKISTKNQNNHENVKIQQDNYENH